MATTTPMGKFEKPPQDTKDDFDDDFDDDVAIEDGERKSDVGENESPLMDRGNERDVVTEVEEKNDEKDDGKKKETKKKKATKGDKKTAARKQQPTTTRKTRGKKKEEEEEKEEKAQPEEITMETRDAKDEGTRATSTTTTTTTISDIQEQEEQEKIQEEIDNEDPMQILKLAVATWQKRGVDPSDAIFEAFPLRLSERKEATMRRLMAALAEVELATA